MALLRTFCAVEAAGIRLMPLAFFAPETTRRGAPGSRPARDSAPSNIQEWRLRTRNGCSTWARTFATCRWIRSSSGSKAPQKVPSWRWRSPEVHHDAGRVHIRMNLNPIVPVDDISLAHTSADPWRSGKRRKCRMVRSVNAKRNACEPTQHRLRRYRRSGALQPNFRVVRRYRDSQASIQAHRRNGARR